MRIDPNTRMTSWTRRRRVAVLALTNLIGLVLVAVAYEVVYRLQPVDFWRPELVRDNPTRVCDTSRPRLLVLGDSFSASQIGLAAHLRAAMTEDCQVIASGVSGMTARDVVLMAPARLSRYQPATTLYQAYIGTDLLETRHPRGVGSWPRRLYWLAIDSGWRSLHFTNYRLGQLRDAALHYRSAAGVSPIDEARSSGTLDVTRYNARTRRLLEADPEIVNRQVLVRGWAEEAWPEYVAKVVNLANQVRESRSRFVIVVIPHCVQASPRYRDLYRSMGAVLSPVVDHSPSAFVSRLRSALPGVTVIDPLPAFQAAEAAGTRLYRLDDPHLDDDGQSILTNEIRRVLDGGCQPGMPQSPRMPR